MDMGFIKNLNEKDSAKAAKFAELILQDLSERLLAMRGFIAAGNKEGTTDAAHAMKSVAAQAGAERFSELCKLIEMRCKGEGDLALAELLLSLENEFHSVETALRIYLE